MHLRDNTLLQGGKYRIVRFIGRGGFGCTYEAEHVMLRTRVAIKEFFVKDFCNRDADTAHVTVATQGKKELVAKLRKKFIDEAITLNTISHPHIVHVTDVFEENATAYYVMDYVEGSSLQEMVKQKGALPEAKALNYIHQLCEAVGYVHSMNRLHLDIKPGNILVDKNNRVVLIDFGTSKQYDEANGENTSTLMGYSRGYAPAEQMGKDIKKFAPATDVYAVGATLYKLLSGNTPPNVTDRIAGEELVPLPSSISKITRKAIDSALQMRKVDRPQSIAAFRAMLYNTTEPNADEEVEVEVIAEETIVSVENTHKGHEYVDLGLSVKWATCNVGANKPEEYGDYFAWGETEPKKEYTKKNSKTYGKVLRNGVFEKPEFLSRNKNVGNIAGDERYDAVRANWGGSWRLPTKEEIEELLANCTHEWTTQNGKKGRLFTSKKNGKSIFLPAAGYRNGSSLYYAGEYGYYWSATPLESNSNVAYGLLFSSGNAGWDWNFRFDGHSVRPVTE